MQPKLSQEIQLEKDKLLSQIEGLSRSELARKQIDGTGGKVSVSDLIAYQIGWGKCLIRWYQNGIKGQMPDMPGDGFLKWDYNAIAQHFYQTYQFDSSTRQIAVFQEVVSRILEIIEIESKTGNLEQIGVWAWCTLPSGKKWPLSKWIQVNTAAPYKRARQLIQKAMS